MAEDIIFYIMLALGVFLPIILVLIAKLYDERYECKKIDITIRPKIVNKYASEYAKTAKAKDHIIQYKIADKYEEKAKAKVLDILNNMS